MGEESLCNRPSTGAFATVSSSYKHLRRGQQEQAHLKWVWHKSIPLKVSFLLWRIFHGLIAFDDVLVRLGFSLASKCPFCLNSDSLNHGFFFLSFGPWSLGVFLLSSLIFPLGLLIYVPFYFPFGTLNFLMVQFWVFFQLRSVGVYG